MCFCCMRRSDAGHCPCVISTCRRCLLCLRHCTCPPVCGDDTDIEPLDTELDAADGPFHGLENPVG